MSRGRTLNIDYFSVNKNNLTVTKVDPYNLIFREGAWYIIAYCHMKDEVETFKVSRIKSVKVTDEIYMRPYTFSLKEYLKNNWGVFRGEKIKVSVRFDKKLEDFIKNTKWHINQQIEDEENDFIIFSVYLNETNEIKKWIMSFGKMAEVIEPESLREEIKQEIEAMYKKY